MAHRTFKEGRTIPLFVYKYNDSLIALCGWTLSWPAGFAFGFLRGLCGVSLKGIRDQVGVFPQPVGMALDLDDDGMVQQAVQQGRGHDVIAEDSAPVSEAAIGGEHGGAFLVAGIDQLEEQVGAAGFDRQVANLIDDQQGDPVNIAQARLEGTGAFGLGKGGWNESGLPGPGSWPRWTPVDNSVWRQTSVHHCTNASYAGCRSA